MSKISIDVKSRTPIFEQLRHNITELALSGILAPDEQLPSVRALACDLAINPNTIQKAYAELERDGIIYSLPARGSFISSDLSAAARSAKTEALCSVTNAVRQAKLLGASKEELYKLLEREWR